MFKNITKIGLLSASILLGQVAMAQDNLINAVSKNSSDASKASFQFSAIYDIENTSIKNQGSSGTCWSYSGKSFLESEMIKKGKKPIEISQIYTARNAYIEKAKQYVRMHGHLDFGQGGCFHDVTNMLNKYGALPRMAYTGLQNDASKNNFGEFFPMLENMLKEVVKNPRKNIDPSWQKAFTGILDAYLGDVPKSFNYNGKIHTPQSFAKEEIGIDANDYIEVSSLKDHPWYSQFVLPIPDNWAFNQVYNFKLTDMTEAIDHALKNGYSVAWGGDVSEKSFSWKNGVAFVADKATLELDAKELFNGPKTEPEITDDMRQLAFDAQTTTDDHGMHIVGLYKDQNGKEYYKIKNSWDANNDYKGYLYMTKAYVQYKTTALMFNKNALTKAILNKINLK
jgi:bleomycin hydrolase